MQTDSQSEDDVLNWVVGSTHLESFKLLFMYLYEMLPVDMTISVALLLLMDDAELPNTYVAPQDVGYGAGLVLSSGTGVRLFKKGG